jgi:hypothetical protein
VALEQESTPFVVFILGVGWVGLLSQKRKEPPKKKESTNDVLYFDKIL